MGNIPTFVAIDLETTGLDFEKDEIIEVALVRFENGVPVEDVDYLVKPTTASLRPFIENLTEYTRAILKMQNHLQVWQARFIPLSEIIPLLLIMPHLIRSF